jgi:hypothetical protein
LGGKERKGREGKGSGIRWGGGGYARKLGSELRNADAQSDEELIARTNDDCHLGDIIHLCILLLCCMYEFALAYLGGHRPNGR